MNSSSTLLELAGRERLLAASGQHATVGTGLKHSHVDAILQDSVSDWFFEVHAENYMGAGGPPHRMLNAIRADHPISLHGVSMSIGGPDPLDATHLARFDALVRRYQPSWVSEHLAWSSHGGHYLNDLLPVPYTQQSLANVCAHIDQVQNRIQRSLLLENPSTYLAFEESTLSETEFIGEVVRRTGCGLLLDVNNIYVSAINHHIDPLLYLCALPLHQVGEVHLAGHHEQRTGTGDRVLIDSHDRQVDAAVWALYTSAVERIGAVPTLIEWDSELPSWPTLRDEALKAREVLRVSSGRPTEQVQHAD